MQTNQIQIEKTGKITSDVTNEETKKRNLHDENTTRRYASIFKNSEGMLEQLD